MTKPEGWKFLVLIFLIVPSVYGQKVKYKDIFALLSTKQYEQAEPFLKRYLKENDDNPNAYLYMGIIYQEKAAKADILKQTSIATQTMDSAMVEFDKAYKTVDEREVRKNKEYYQAYSRRDLRTGEFGVKLSDIQFDIEKRIEGLKERISKVKMVKHYFVLSDSLYKKSNALYQSIQKKYPSENQFYLRSDENSLKELTSLINKFDSCTKALDGYRSSTANYGKTGYDQNFTLAEIADFKKDGAELADFFQSEIKIWDYKKFGEKAKSIIEKEIIPMREHLITYDIEINKLRDKLHTDSVSVRSDLTKLIDKLLYEQLEKFDPNPLPMEVFSLKTSDLEYLSVLVENKALRDTSDLHLKLQAVNSELKMLHKLDSVSSRLSDEVIDKRSADYNEFITNTYSNPIVLKSYVKAIKEFVERERKTKTEAQQRQMKALEWIVDGADSIPLKQPLAANRFKPVSTVEEKYTMGVHVNDTLNVDGYFYTIKANRKPEIKVIFPVDKISFKEKFIPAAKGLSYADATGQIYFVLLYSENLRNQKYPATLAKIYRSDGLAWSVNYDLGFLPKEILFRQDTGEVTLKNETQQTVIDKNGKVLK